MHFCGGGLRFGGVALRLTVLFKLSGYQYTTFSLSAVLRDIVTSCVDVPLSDITAVCCHPSTVYWPYFEPCFARHRSLIRVAFTLAAQW